jgi:23S rRNA pseudouridine1911/1915/1917 synthase
MTASDFNGKKAITNYKTIKVFNSKDIPKISLIECKLETGRTHQIRVHMQYKGTSLLGDKAKIDLMRTLTANLDSKDKNEFDKRSKTAELILKEREIDSNEKIVNQQMMPNSA